MAIGATANVRSILFLSLFLVILAQLCDTAWHRGLTKEMFIKMKPTVLPVGLDFLNLYTIV